MRYFNIPTVSFNDANGRTVPVKDVRPIGQEVVDFGITTKEGDLLDEIASREEIFGPGSEDESFRLFDANIVELYEARFDVSKVRRLSIPV